MSHRFTLKPYTKLTDREQCQACGKKRCFSPYIDTEGTIELSKDVGRCNREVNCGYHYKPKQYFEDNPEIKAALFGGETNGDGTAARPRAAAHVPPPQPPASFIPDGVFDKSLGRYEENNFVKYLNSLFPADRVSEAIAAYQIGTSKHWPGSTVFWQISISGEIRAGKIMLYNPEKGKRVKEPYNHITWAHKALSLEDYNLKQCFFGEHLLGIRPNDPIAVVESEKTAIIASLYLPEIIWLACGSLNNLSIGKSSVLAGRVVTLFPDLNGYEKWRERAGELASLCTVNTSDLLERIAGPEEREKGLDLADYLISVNPREIKAPTAPENDQAAHRLTGFISCLNNVLLMNLKEEFKAEFLKPQPLNEAAQRILSGWYYSKGLPRNEIKAVIEELITAHHFIVS